MNLKKYLLPDNQYYKETCNKDLIVLHHTVSSGSAKNVIDYWMSNSDIIGTCYVIDKDGTILECYENDKQWAWHIGGESILKCTYEEAKKLNQRSIGIELVNMGGLKKQNNLFLDSFGKPFNGNITQFGYNYRGYDGCETYTQEQLNSCFELVKMLLQKHNIPKDIPKEPWEKNKYWLKYTGVVSHTTLRGDKTDVHPLFPYKKLIEFCDLKVDN